MRRRILISIPVILIFIIMLTIACVLPAPVARLFASATPTSTATPERTPTPSATPLPPLSIAPCPRGFDCPDAIGIYDLAQDIKSGVEATVEVPYDQPISFHAGWIAFDEGIARQNASKMDPFVEIDGVNYWQDAYMGDVQPYTDENDPSKIYASAWEGVVLSGWRISESHLVRIGFTFNEQITDGWDVYPKGYTVEFIYRVYPVMRPTETPTPEPTATLTPRPTSTYKPKPTTIPVTPTAACEGSGTISIINDTGGQVTLYLTGPAKYTFYIPAGSQTLNVCPGSYSYTGYGCGGASKNGTVSTDTEEITFYCVSN